MAEIRTYSKHDRDVAGEEGGHREEKDGVREACDWLLSRPRPRALRRSRYKAPGADDAVHRREERQMSGADYHACLFGSRGWLSTLR